MSTDNNGKKIKLSTELSALTDLLPMEPILYPFYAPKQDDVFANYIESGSNFFCLSSLEEADLIVVPNNWEILLNSNQIKATTQLIHRAKRAGKSTVSFFGGDCSHLELPAETDIVFRQSLYDFMRNPNDFAFPAWSEDILIKYANGKLIPRPKSTKPVVSFCGFANQNDSKIYFKHYVLKSFRNLKIGSGRKGIPPYSSGHILRAKALSVLSQSSKIKTNFVLRSSSFFTSKSLDNTEQQRAEFVQNLLASDYVLCPRGSGNYSFRFYEALCCGRIPIFVNTDCVLPYDFEIDWRRYCVWIEEYDLSRIDEKVIEFHERLSPSKFVELQQQCRQLWEDYIEPSGFFEKLHRHLEKIT